MDTFQTPQPPTVVVEAGAGRVEITADETAQTTVQLTPLDAAGEAAVAAATVEQRGSAIAVVLPRHGGLFRQSGAVAVLITCPRDSTLDVRTGSAPVRARAAYAEASIATGSGDIDVETVAGSARLKSGSGDIRVGGASGEVDTRTGSGDVEIDRLDGALQTKSGSGSLTVRQCRDRCDPCHRCERRHLDRHRARHRGLARRLHRLRPGHPGARRVRGPQTRSAPGADQRAHREWRPAGAPVMRPVSSLGDGVVRRRRASRGRSCRSGCRCAPGARPAGRGAPRGATTCVRSWRAPRGAARRLAHGPS